MLPPSTRNIPSVPSGRAQPGRSEETTACTMSQVTLSSCVGMQNDGHSINSVSSRHPGRLPVSSWAPPSIWCLKVPTSAFSMVPIRPGGLAATSWSFPQGDFLGVCWCEADFATLSSDRLLCPPRRRGQLPVRCHPENNPDSIKAKVRMGEHLRSWIGRGVYYRPIGTRTGIAGTLSGVGIPSRKNPRPAVSSGSLRRKHGRD
jgi:hypothetical protein